MGLLENKLMNSDYDLTIYSAGLLYCSVCTDAPVTEMINTVNEHNPSGTADGWRVSSDNFEDGSINPSACDKKPKHYHYLLSC